MENKVKVSVILPVYNVQQYLEQCLESLVNQTLEDIEIIAINDGSTDNSGDILKRYCAKYPHKLRQVTTENNGLSAARNLGISLAQGEYLICIDSDDFVEPEMLEVLYNQAKENDCDAAICAYQRVYEDGREPYPISLKVTVPYNQPMNYDYEMLRLSPYAWNKMFRREMLINSGIFYPVGMKYEDIGAIYPWLAHAKRITLTDKVLYNYRFGRPNSIMSDRVANCQDMLASLKICTELVRERKITVVGEQVLCELNLRHIYFRFRDFRKVKGNTRLMLKFVKDAFQYLNAEFPHWRQNAYFDHIKGSRLNKKLKRHKLFVYISVLSKHIRIR